ncbi:MAG: hypothetical protein HYT71_02885 [Candidatus Aenigmarchaeota archaeon]|nr:hypothetical protein [Candidatus Aenigmarchaeota archaeon]
MNDEQKAVFLALVIGIIAGFVSKNAGADLGLVLGVVFGYVFNLGQKKIFAGKKDGWSAGNILVPYIFTWIITWIFLVNV